MWNFPPTFFLLCKFFIWVGSFYRSISFLISLGQKNKYSCFWKCGWREKLYPGGRKFSFYLFFWSIFRKYSLFFFSSLAFFAFFIFLFFFVFFLLLVCLFFEIKNIYSYIFWYTFNYTGGWVIKICDFQKQDYFFLRS